MKLGLQSVWASKAESGGGMGVFLCSVFKLNVFFVGCQGSLFMLCAEMNEGWVKFDLQCDGFQVRVWWRQGSPLSTWRR